MDREHAAREGHAGHYRDATEQDGDEKQQSSLSTSHLGKNVRRPTLNVHAEFRVEHRALSVERSAFLE
jgi:hypothetical protein